MIKRHISFYANDFKPLNYCGEVIGYEAEVRTYELPFEIEPTTGEHDFNKCEGCQKNLKTIAKNFTEKYNGNGQKKGFPFCCSYHSNLVKIKEFNRVDFLNAPEMAARKIIYTNQHIRNNHNSENWYRLITDYIDIVFQSFGQMPSGCGEPLFLGNYLNSIANSVKENKDIQPEKRNRILEFLNAYNTPVKEQKTDLNILLSIYEKWYKIFPFELTSYFGNLKQHFEKQLPIINGKPEINIYSGIAKVNIHTKSSLIEALISLTDSLLTQINGVTLYEKGLITDTNKIKLELLINSRKLKLKQGYKNSSASEEQRYRKILKEWFNDEKKFIDELTPLLKAGTPQPTETKAEQPTPEIKPKIKPEAIQAIYDLLKDFFSEAHQTELLQILKTGNNASEPLIFLDNGNRLADAFKQLIKTDIITGCEQKELESWICNNFKFRYRKQIKEFKARYINDIISTNKDKCQNPILNVTVEKATGNILIAKA